MADNWQLKAVLSANAESMLRTLKSVNQATRTTRKYLSDVGTSAVKLAGHIGMPIGLIGGAMSAFSAAGLKQAVTNFAQLGDEVHKSAQRIGISTDEYQRFKYIAGQTGVSAEELGGAMGKLNKNIALAAAGKNKDLAALFKRAGISMRGANGELRSATDMLPELADLFQRNGNAAVQARMGNAVLGKSWQTLAPLMQGGSQGIDQLTERYKRLGISVEENAIVAGEAFGDQMDDMRLVAASYGNTITAKLLPALAPLLEKTIQWAVANRELLTTKISKFITEMADSLSKVDWASIIEGFGSFVSAVRGFVDWIGGARNALIALVMFMNAGAILALFQMGGAILRLAAYLTGPLISALRMVWTVMMANPIGMLIAAVVGFGLIVYQNWDSIVAYISTAWERIKSVFSINFFDGIIQVWLEAWQGLANGILGIIKTILPDVLMPDAMKNFNFTFASDRAASLAGGDLPSLVNPQSRGKVEGQVNININGLPPGSRVEQVAGGGNMPLNLSAGYRSAALGMP